MCRVLAYMGPPVSIDDLLYKPDSSLILQSYQPRLHFLLNLAGFGMTAWDPGSHQPDVPFVYRTPEIPVFDRNLKAFAEKIHATALIAHVRGVSYHERVTVGVDNLHPFRYPCSAIAFAHNGNLCDFYRMRYALLPHIRPEIASHIRGNTDTEWIYALFLSQLEDPSRPLDVEELPGVLRRTLVLIRELRAQLGIDRQSAANLFFSDGRTMAAARYTFDFGRLTPGQVSRGEFFFTSLWFTCGQSYGYRDGEWKMIGGIDHSDAIILSSEPLTRDMTTWLEVPEYSMLVVHRDDGGAQRIRFFELDV